jgi:hypothetical protein
MPSPGGKNENGDLNRYWDDGGSQAGKLEEDYTTAEKLEEIK